MLILRPLQRCILLRITCDRADALQLHSVARFGEIAKLARQGRASMRPRQCGVRVVDLPGSAPDRLLFVREATAVASLMLLKRPKLA
ncbi:hypothetical protein MF271_12295 [Deinococcus sp. KNUC1210]|uniref:hypothetical protein n=1 Tax=Deinococcus sp. KNUC1210 TaxID=2917691 RepID=UPI001EEFE607|nr:hypothetical protein [Deinococcus sp. KNUC1210]ULH14771.1 hypothetical protein MF271_12295 [Deinococcus sp. KNUC1210]